MLLPRSCLPLAYLDIGISNGSGQDSRLFAAHIPALEDAAGDRNPHKPPCVLIAECNGRSTYAIERVRRGIYAQCRLSCWVTIDHLENLRVPEPTAAAPSKPPCSHETKTWWRPLVAHKKNGELSQPAQDPGTPSCKKISLDLGKPLYITPRPTTPMEETPFAGLGKPASTAATEFEGKAGQDVEQVLVNRTLQNPDDLLKSVKTQYMESLYRSKASLAYFAKGPLSRARAAFTDNDGLPTSRRQLVDYLRDSIVPLNLLDKKYRETLADLVSEVPDAHISEDERTELVTKFHKAIRKSKKEKIRKNGLFPQEEVDVLRWWLSHPLSPSICESAELRAEATKAKILEQRARETQLQIILVLEVLALETALPIASVVKVSEDVQGEVGPNKQRKPKKQQDLTLLLDLSIDRLCIWQSMTVESDSSSKKPGDTEPTLIEDLHRRKQNTNHLRDFCVDVVLPL